MDTPFLEISGVVVNAAHIESVEGLAGAPGSAVHVHFLSGNNRSFEKADADGLRRFFAPQTEAPPEASPKSAPKAVEVTAADVAAAQPPKKAVIA